MNWKRRIANTLRTTGKVLSRGVPIVAIICLSIFLLVGLWQNPWLVLVLAIICALAYALGLIAESISNFVKTHAD